MTWDLTLGPEAEADIAAAQDWHDQRIPGLGVEFVAVVRRAIGMIAENPFQYPVIWKDCRRAVLRRFPYFVHYVISGHTVMVVACTRGRRDRDARQERADEV